MKRTLMLAAAMLALTSCAPAYPTYNPTSYVPPAWVSRNDYSAASGSSGCTIKKDGVPLTVIVVQGPGAPTHSGMLPLLTPTICIRAAPSTSTSTGGACPGLRISTSRQNCCPRFFRESSRCSNGRHGRREPIAGGQPSCKAFRPPMTIVSPFFGSEPNEERSSGLPERRPPSRVQSLALRAEPAFAIVEADLGPVIPLRAPRRVD